MSLQPSSIPPVPQETARVARAAFWKGSGLRQARYRGLKKIHLQNVATAAAVNVARLGAWWERRPHAPTRISRFARLAA